MESGREIKLLFRMVTLIILALVCALGVLVLLDNREIDKLIAPSGFRTALMVIAPLFPISLTFYQLQARTFGVRSLKAELSLLLGTIVLYLGIVASRLFGTPAAAPVCSYWWFGCDTEVVGSRLSITILMLAAALSAALCLYSYSQCLLRIRRSQN